MSRTRELRLPTLRAIRALRPIGVCLALAALAPTPFVLAPAARAVASLPDVVTLRDGSEVRCRVLEVDARRVLVESEAGAQVPYPRADVVRIEFGQAAPPPIVARVKVVDADDDLRLYLDGAEIGTPAELRGAGFDLAPLLREGPNVLEARVTNDSGTWAYRWTLEAGAHREVFSCGLAFKSGCRQGGRSGSERGTFEAGKVYLYVHRSSGEVKVQKN